MALVKYVVFHPWRATTILLVGIFVGLASFYVYQVNTALGAVAVEEFDPGRARAAIAAEEPEVKGLELDSSGDPQPRLEEELAAIEATLGETTADPDFNAAAFGDPIADSIFEAYLLVGTDASGFLADTIILALQPADDSDPIMVSLPRDLLVWNMCKGTFTRINTGLGGCGAKASGSELLAILVEDYTGIAVDHLARINFDGFARVIDVLGGIDVCIDNPRRDIKAHLLLENSGCQRLDGEEALGWVRSRNPEEFVGGEWQAMGGSDFGRQARQQDVLFQLAGKASNFSSPSTLTNTLDAVKSSVRLDYAWSLGDAAATAWRYRGISKDDVQRFSVEVVNYRTTAGAAVLLPTMPFADQLEEFYDLP